MLSDFRLQYTKHCGAGTEQAHRPMEQNAEPTNKATYIWSINTRQRNHKYTMGKTGSVGKAGQLHASERNWIML